MAEKKTKRQQRKSVTEILGLFIIIAGLLEASFLLLSGKAPEIAFLALVLANTFVGFVVYKIDKFDEIVTKLFTLRAIRKEIFAKAEEVKRVEKRINKTKGILTISSKAFIEAFFLSLMTRNQYPLPKKVINKILSNLDRIAELAIPNKAKREKFINNLGDILKEKNA